MFYLFFFKENASKGEETKSEEDPSPSAESKTANDTTSDSQGEESRINAKWTNEELLLGVQGVRTFGKDFHVSGCDQCMFKEVWRNA